LLVPARAVIKRTDLYAVYVVAADGKPQLRQVRVGRSIGDQIEILAGLRAGERIALDPLTASHR
jgi:multidrug efflux pump subunit AcrA (membrane-fusion protein)